jgi:hypothetical protein
MPIVHECAAPACHVLTMGSYCVEHECSSTGASFLEGLDVARGQALNPSDLPEGRESTPRQVVSG